jgi:hypothetical protein
MSNDTKTALYWVGEYVARSVTVQCTILALQELKKTSTSVNAATLQAKILGKKDQ